METAFGSSYVVDGALQTPSGGTPAVRVVWFLETGHNVPYLVTAYPLERVE